STTSTPRPSKRPSAKRSNIWATRWHRQLSRNLYLKIYTFVHTSYTLGLHGHHSSAVLLRDVEDAYTGRQLCDHAWLPYPALWADTAIRECDVVELEARVTSYRKGYCGMSANGRIQPIQMDYGFTDPTFLR